MDSVAGVEHLVVLRHRNQSVANARRLQRAAGRGGMVRLRSGCYVPTSVWSTLGQADRMRLEAAAAHEAGRGSFVASHASAAALWGVPRIGRPDGLVHARATTVGGTRSENGMRRHAVRDPGLHLTTVGGVPVSTLERTVVDLAMTDPFAEAVVAADWALRRRTTSEALRRALDELDPPRGRARVERVLDFADAASESPGESLSRVLVHEVGLPAPLLQVRFDDAAGLIGYVDFYWPGIGLVGEFDGLVKYTDGAVLGDRTPSEVVVREKLREDRLRRVARGVTRWVWSTLRAPGALAAQLRAAGLRPGT